MAHPLHAAIEWLASHGKVTEAKAAAMHFRLHLMTQAQTYNGPGRPVLCRLIAEMPWIDDD